MTMARSKLVDPELTRVDHGVSRCVRKAFLIRGEDGRQHDHARWLEARLKDLGETFTISVISSAVMSDHLHVFERLDPERARARSAEEVAERWARLCPPRDARRKALPVTPEWLAGRADHGGAGRRGDMHCKVGSPRVGSPRNQRYSSGFRSITRDRVP